MIKQPFFSFEIKSDPASVNSRNVKPEVNGAWQKIDDSCWVCDKTINRITTLKYSLIYCLALILIGLFKIAQLGQTGINMFLCVNIPFAIPGILTAIYSKVAPGKKLVFNRLEGTVELPGFLFGKSQTVPFESLKIKTGFAGGPTVRLVAMYKGTVLPVDLPKADVLNISSSWSTIVWYMDKNRPLPPGSAFDPYRKKDDERRGKEGNPPPLYPYPSEEKHGEGKRAMTEWYNTHIKGLPPSNS